MISYPDTTHTTRIPPGGCSYQTQLFWGDLIHWKCSLCCNSQTELEVILALRSDPAQMLGTDASAALPTADCCTLGLLVLPPVCVYSNTLSI